MPNTDIEKTCEFTYPITKWPHWRRCTADATVVITVQHGGQDLEVAVCSEHAKVSAS